MCLLTLAWKKHPRYPLIFAGNRDEFHARPSAAAGWWPDAPDVFGGRDLEAGGSWLGVTRGGRFAVVTNFREPDRREPGLRSRGELPAAFLTSDISASDYLQYLHENGVQYSGFNLLFGDRENMFYCSNRHGEDGGITLPPGVHALSNHLLNTPWPKVRRLHARFELEIARDLPRVEALLEMLGDTTPVADDDLPHTGLPAEWERLLSAAKVVSPDYGTRASTVVMIDNMGEVTFHERRFTSSGHTQGEARERFGPPTASGTITT